MPGSAGKEEHTNITIIFIFGGLFLCFNFFCEVKCDWMSCIGSSIINRLLAKCSALDLEQNLCRRNSTHLWDKIQEVYTAEDVWSSQLSFFRLSSARNNLGLLCCSKSVVSNFKMIIAKAKIFVSFSVVVKLFQAVKPSYLWTSLFFLRPQVKQANVSPLIPSFVSHQRPRKCEKRRPTLFFLRHKLSTLGLVACFSAEEKRR